VYTPNIAYDLDFIILNSLTIINGHTMNEISLDMSYVNTTLYSLVAREELLVSHQAPPQVADRGRLTRNGGCWGNKILRVDQNQHHCLLAKVDLQRLGEETPTENQPAQRLRRQPHH
jgi:hypothetical protein